MHRYTDFLVNEILPSGEVIHLDNLKAPPKPPKTTGRLKDAGEKSSADTTEHKAEDLPAVMEQYTTKQEEAMSTSATTSKDEKQSVPHPDTLKPEHPAFEPKDDLPMTEAPQAIPQSMQGFDKHELAPVPTVDQKKISPHKRIPPAAPSIPLSMQDLDSNQPEPKEETAPRRKEKVHIRQTSQGWVEFDKEKEDQIRKRKAEEDAAAGVQPEDKNKMEDIKPEETADVPELNQPNSEQVPKESTQAAWQAFAASAPTSGFQVSSQALVMITY